MTKSNNTEVITVDRWYEMGREYYLEALDLEEADGDQSQINALSKSAAAHFWQTLVVGHVKAPYSLSLCFKQGVGTTPDDYIFKLLFGVALELKDPKCQAKVAEVQIPSSMNSAIQGLTQLIKNINSKVDIDDHMNMQLVISQMQIFDKSISLPHFNKGQTITGLFINENQDLLADNHNQHIMSHEYQHDESPTIVLGNDNSNDDSNCCTII